MKIVGILGFKGSGKDTAAAALIEDGYVKFAFADALKDVIAVVFNWPRNMMEGDTAESRAWREVPDAWWSEKLGIENFTPRLAMQLVGTDTMRNHFNDQIWIANIESKILGSKHEKIVITDCRFANEVKLVKDLGGTIIRVRKGEEPSFFKWTSQIYGERDIFGESVRHLMKEMGIHPSEWEWNGTTPDAILENNSSIADLHNAIRKAV